MKDYIVFLDVQNPQFLPLLQGVVARGFTPILSGGPLAEECRRAGLGFRRWEAYIPPDLPLRLDRELKRRLTDLAQAFQTPAVRRAFAARGGDFLTSIHQPFFQQLVQILTLELSALEIFRRLEARHRPRLIVLGCDNSPSQRALVLAAAQSGIPTLQLAHGMLGPTWGRVAGEMHTLYSQYLAAYGRRSRDFLVSQGNPPERIFLTGAPLWDHLYRPESRINPGAAKERLGLDPARPVVLFTTSYADGSSAFFPAILRRHQAIHEAVLGAMCRLGGELQLLVRPHPQEVGRVGISPQKTARLDRAYQDYVAARYGVRVHLWRSHKTEAMRAAEVVLVTGQSSVIPEAMILERPVVSVAIFPEEARTYSRKDGVIIVEEDGDLAEILQNILVDQNLREELHLSQQKALEEINEGHDGRATRRVASLIAELAGGRSSFRWRSKGATEGKGGSEGLKVLMAAHNFLPHSYAGTEIYTRDLARALQSRGHEVRVMYPRPRAKKPGEPEFAISEGVFEGLEVVQMEAPLQVYGSIHNEGLKPVLGEYLKKHRPDLVHIQHLMGLTVSLLELLKEMNIPIVMTANDYWLLCNQIHLMKDGGMICEGPETIDKCVSCMVKSLGQVSEQQMPHLFYYMADRYYSHRRGMQLLDMVLFPSRYQMELHKRYGFVNQQMVHLPQGANLFKPHRHRRHSGPPVKISYLGNICYRKGLDILVTAFNETDSAEAELHLYGKVVESEYFERIKASIRPGKKVIYHGGYGPADLPHILAGTDVAVVPSRGENYPFVIREILHAKVPVIAAAVAGIPEIIQEGENGFLFRPNEAADLAAKLQMVIDHPEIIEELRARIKPVKSIEEDAREIEGLYRQVLQARGWAGQGQGLTKEQLRLVNQTGGSSGLEEGKETGTGRVEISIIIPVFNNLELNRQCLESIYRFTELAGVEIIVVDNGSSDGSTEYLRQEESCGRVRLLANERNQGFAKACNQGARASRGEYLVFLNNDTIVTPGWLTALYNCQAKNDAIGIVGAKLLYPDDTVQHAGVAFDDQKHVGHIYRGFHESHPAVNKRREFQVVTAACMMIRRSLFFEVGGFVENYQNGFEDVDLCFQIRQRGYRVYYTPECVVYHLESKTPGRHAKETENSRYFWSRWRDEIIPDWLTYYREDGIILEFLEYDDKGTPLYIMRDQEVTRLWQQAAAFKKEGLFSQAIEKYRQALRLNPYDNRHYLITAELAETYQMAGKEEEAACLYQFLVKCTPDPKYPYKLALLQKKLGKLKEAVMNLEHAKAIIKDGGRSEEGRRQKGSGAENGTQEVNRYVGGGQDHGCSIPKETPAF